MPTIKIDIGSFLIELQFCAAYNILIIYSVKITELINADKIVFTVLAAK